MTDRRTLMSVDNVEDCTMISHEPRADQKFKIASAPSCTTILAQKRKLHSENVLKSRSKIEAKKAAQAQKDVVAIYNDDLEK